MGDGWVGKRYGVGGGERELWREWLGVRKCSQGTLFLLSTSQLLATSHPLGRDPGFPLQHRWHCPTRERGARSLECLATIKDREGERPGREPAISFSFEKGETEALKAYVQG